MDVDAIDIVAARGAPHQQEAATRLARGLRRHGIKTRIVSAAGLAETPVVAAWGWRIGEEARTRGATVLVQERAYVGDRFSWTSLGFDGLNGRARFPLVEDGGDRWRRYFPDALKPLRPGEGKVLVLGQVPGDMALKGAPVPGWYARAGRTLGARYGAAVEFRPHPDDTSPRIRGRSMHGLALSKAATLAEALAEAAVVAAWNSNSLTDAALAGVSLVAGDSGAMTWPLAGHGLDTPARLAPREPWAHRLAWTQWTPEEIESGAAWEVVRTALARDAGLRFGDWRDGADSVHTRAA